MRPSAFKHIRIAREVIPHVRPTVPLWPCNKNSKLDNVTRTDEDKRKKRKKQKVTLGKNRIA